MAAIFDARYLITLDGSRYFSSESVHCAHCLTTTKNGTTRYHHDILQAAIVHPDKRQVLPLAPVFVRNSDADGGNYRKQDCEITAGYRMRPGSATIPVWPQLSADSLLQPVRRAGDRQTDDHKSLYQDVEPAAVTPPARNAVNMSRSADAHITSSACAYRRPMRTPVPT